MEEKVQGGPHPVSAQVLREGDEERKKKKEGKSWGGNGIFILSP